MLVRANNKNSQFALAMPIKPRHSRQSSVSLPRSRSHVKNSFEPSLGPLFHSFYLIMMQCNLLGNTGPLYGDYLPPYRKFLLIEAQVKRACFVGLQFLQSYLRKFDHTYT